METTTKTRTNRYDADCLRCGGRVPAEQGSLHKTPNGWAVRHLDADACNMPGPAPAAPTAPAAAPHGQDNEVGVYVFENGTIVKVQPNKAKTRVYAQRWQEIGGERLVDATEEHVRGDWFYEAGLINRVAGARKMTLDEAKAFIIRYGKCVRCSRKLKAAKSVEQGLGPICIKYFTLG